MPQKNSFTYKAYFKVPKRCLYKINFTKYAKSVQNVSRVKVF